jgi:hydrogenase maturation protease
VIGVGNILHQDEGIGVHLVQALKSYDLPPGVELIDAGTALLDVLLDTADRGKIVIVDAICAGGEPGDVYRLPLEAFCSGIEEGGNSLHELSLLATMNLLRLQLRRLPDVVIIGVEPQEIGSGVGLSFRVQERLKSIVALVLEEVVN